MKIEYVKYNGSSISHPMDGIKINGHRGTWYTLGESTFKGSPVFLLEHELYGDEAAGLIVKADGTIVHDDVHDGFDNLWDLS